MRSLLIRVDPVQLDVALRAWHQAHGGADSALTIDARDEPRAERRHTAHGNRHVVGKVVPRTARLTPVPPSA